MFSRKLYFLRHWFICMTHIVSSLASEQHLALTSHVNLYAIFGTRWLQHLPTIIGHELLICWIDYLMDQSVLIVFVTMGLRERERARERERSSELFVKVSVLGHGLPSNPEKPKTQVSLLFLYINHLFKHLSPVTLLNPLRFWYFSTQICLHKFKRISWLLLYLYSSKTGQMSNNFGI